MEANRMLAVYRHPNKKRPLRYAPIYLANERRRDIPVVANRHSCPSRVVAGVHQSYLPTQFESFVGGRPTQEVDNLCVSQSPSFSLTERGRLEAVIAPLLGGMHVLLRLAVIHDDIITRLCEAHQREKLGPRQIKAAKLAAKQSFSK
jgi:hypothetical protein